MNSGGSRSRCLGLAVARRAPRPPSTGAPPTSSIQTLPILCVSSLRRGHANLLCIALILTDGPRRESIKAAYFVLEFPRAQNRSLVYMLPPPRS